MMDRSEDRIVDDLIRMTVSEDAPPPVERRLRAQLADLRSWLSQPDREMTRHARGWARPAAWWGPGVTGAAVVIFAAVAVLVLRPQQRFAEVQTAVFAQPGVHARTVASDQTESEESEQ